jgi:hypothetical protein
MAVPSSDVSALSLSSSSSALVAALPAGRGDEPTSTTVWRYFNKGTGRDNGYNVCGQLRCATKIKMQLKGTTSNMRSHLLTAHKIRLASARASAAAALMAESSAVARYGGRPMDAYLLPSASSSSSSSRRPMPSKAEDKEMTLEMLQIAVSMNSSMRGFAENVLLRNFLSKWLSWALPSRWTMSRLLPKYHLCLTNRLKTRLLNVQSLSITTDSTFLSLHQVPYICITGHWIDAEWNLQETVLAVFLAEQSETAGFIAGRLRQVLEVELGMSRKVHCITTDEGMNFLSAVDHLKSAEVVRESVRCACHRLQLTFKKAYLHEDCSTLRGLLDACAAVVNIFKNGWASNKRDILRQHQMKYLERLEVEVANLRQAAAAAQMSSSRADDVARKLKELNDARALLTAEQQHRMRIDEARKRSRDNLAELSAAIAVHCDSELEEPKFDDSDSSDDSDSDADLSELQDDSDRKEAAPEELPTIATDDDLCEETIISAQAAVIIAEADSLQLYVDFIFRKRALIQRAQTRWLTYVRVVERYVVWHEPLLDAMNQIRSSLSAAATRKLGDLPRISLTELDILQQFMVVGRACREVLESLEGSKHTTIGSLLWHHARLKKFLVSTGQNQLFHETVKAFCKRAALNSDMKFNAVVDKPAMVATLLDPRFKELTFLPPAEATKCRDALAAAYSALEAEQSSDVSDIPVAPPSRKKAKASDFSGSILDTVSPKRAAPKSELQRYLEFPCEEDRKHDPLLWWKCHAQRFPTLAILARRYLAIPASSASSERLFSMLKRTATPARNNMSPDTLCMILFVHCQQRELLGLDKH